MEVKNEIKENDKNKENIKNPQLKESKKEKTH